MKCKVLLLFLTLLCSAAYTHAQVRFFDDPDTSIDMDIEAKSKSAILKLATYSRTSHIATETLVITFMNDSTIQLDTFVNRVDNHAIETDIGHGFADRMISRVMARLTPEQAEMFKLGIKSIQITMMPKTFYHEWENDELGLPLYKRYLQSKENVMFKKKKG